MKIVTYIRVSMKSQGESGLGLEAQQADIAAYAAKYNAITLGSFKDIETGRNTKLPELTKALLLAKVTGARLVIAKLDRMGRNAAFLLSLRDAGVDFVCCDDQHTTPLTVGIKAVIAQHELEMISTRTKAALQAAKARGQRLGNPNGAAALQRAGKGNSASRAVATANADAFAQGLASTLADIMAKGHKTLQQIADELNTRGIQTKRKGPWHPTSVKNLQARLA